MFAAILRKSTYNLEQCSNVGFIIKILDFLPQSRDVTSDLLGDILSGQFRQGLNPCILIGSFNSQLKAKYRNPFEFLEVTIYLSTS